VQRIGTTRRNAEAGTWQVAAWYLERCYPTEYGRRAVTVDASVQVTHDDGDLHAARARLAELLDNAPVTMFLASLTSAEAGSALPVGDDPVTGTGGDGVTLPKLAIYRLVKTSRYMPESGW